jgi:hypothetical protein
LDFALQIPRTGTEDPNLRLPCSTASNRFLLRKARIIDKINHNIALGRNRASYALADCRGRHPVARSTTFLVSTSGLLNSGEAHFFVVFGEGTSLCPEPGAAGRFLLTSYSHSDVSATALIRTTQRIKRPPDSTRSRQAALNGQQVDLYKQLVSIRSSSTASKQTT